MSIILKVGSEGNKTLMVEFRLQASLYRGICRYDIMLHLKLLRKILVTIERRGNEDAHEIMKPRP
jgi:hypothetical protein